MEGVFAGGGFPFSDGIFFDKNSTSVEAGIRQGGSYTAGFCPLHTTGLVDEKEKDLVVENVYL